MNKASPQRLVYFFDDEFQPEIELYPEDEDEWAATPQNQQRAMYERMILSGYCRTDH